MKSAKKRILVGLIVIGLLVAMTATASAYTIKPAPDRDGVRLYIDDKWDAWCLATFPSYAADVVLYTASINGIDNQRTKGNIAGEIRSHALGYLAGNHGEPSNPMNIVLNQPDWWPYHLMD